jgi:FkbM family methyltransferase
MLFSPCVSLLLSGRIYFFGCSVSSDRSLASRLLRPVLSLIPREAEVRILRGPLRGKKWIAGSSNHGCWAGTYEPAILNRFASAVSPGSTVYDVGANVGIFTLLAAVRSGPAGHVYSFEPLPRNLAYLRRHIVLNHLENCTVTDAAVSSTEGIRRFAAAAWEHSMGHFAADGEIEVRCMTLGGCIYGAKAFRPPHVLKIDVEGAEMDVLHGAEKAISEFHPAMFLEVHGTQNHAGCREFLRARSYAVEEAYGRLTAAWKPA